VLTGDYNPQESLDNHLLRTQALAQAMADEMGGFDKLNHPNDDRRGKPGGDGRSHPDGNSLDLIVWPEDSAAWDPRSEPIVAAMLDQAVETTGAPMLVGAQDWPATGGRYNIMLLWGASDDAVSRRAEPSSTDAGAGSPDGVVSTGGATNIPIYAKQRPVPFGEYVPMRGLFSRITAQADRIPVDMIAADNPPIIDLPSPRLNRNVPLGLGICFEVAFDDIFRDAVRGGAEVIFIPTNNVWFGQSAQSTQQLAMTQLQAIATGRAAAQISTVGVSGVFAPDGTLVARTGLFVPDYLSARMPLRTSITPAVRLGAWPGIFVQIAALALPAAGLLLGRTGNLAPRESDYRQFWQSPKHWRRRRRARLG
jgi:apolipoprotein N-acyltransferase